jgi:hypothetical protein
MHGDIYENMSIVEIEKSQNKYQLWRQCKVDFTAGFSLQNQRVICVGVVNSGVIFHQPVTLAGLPLRKVAK